jgi:NADPH-dependent ferric siderophore reductase
MDTVTDLEVRRVRHALKFRLLQVARVTSLNPQLLRITLTGSALEGFTSLSYDDHVKVFFPAPGADKPLVPTAGPDGPVWPEGGRPVMRDFTPRRYDAKANELDLEFALHEAGPATEWARQAKPGQYLGVGGPRGSMIIPTGFDWHLLVGDESALPAIARRLEELPAGAFALAIIEVRDAAAQIGFSSQAEHYITWCHRGPGERGAAMMRAVERLTLPAGDGFVWAAGEAAVMRRVRANLVKRGVDKRRIRASAYWKQGAQAVHENIED